MQLHFETGPNYSKKDLKGQVKKTIVVFFLHTDVNLCKLQQMLIWLVGLAGKTLYLEKLNNINFQMQQQTW